MPNERRYSNELNLESVGINLPYNMQAEQSVLGAVLLKPDTLTDLVEILKPEMFYTRQNAQIWTEMLRLFTNDQTIDFVTLLDAVVSDGVFPSADEAKIYLTGLAETVPSISNVKAYAQIVQEKYLVRRRRAGRRSSAGKRRAAYLRDPLRPRFQRPDPAFVQHGGNADQPAKDQRPGCG